MSIEEVSEELYATEWAEEPVVEKKDILLSVVVPVYNEEKTLREIIHRIRGRAGMKVEIICVDDGSEDNSYELMEDLKSRELIDVIIRQDGNRGKGEAIRTGLMLASGDVVVIQDADLEYDPAEYRDLIQPILEGKADAVYGSRFLGGPQRVLYFWHRVGNGFLTLMSNMFTNLNLSDMETCYKMIRADLIKKIPLESQRFGFEVEITAKLAQAGARIYELPISYSGRTYEEGKKISWRDGVAAISHILRFNIFRKIDGPIRLSPFREVLEDRSR